MKRIGLLVVVIFLLTGCQSFGKTTGALTDQWEQKDGFLLDTYVKIKIPTSQKASVQLTQAFDYLKAEEAKLSLYQADSEVTKINQAAGKKAVAVSDSTYEVIKAAQHFSQQSDGAFDLTIGALSSLWQIGSKKAKKPSPTEIQQALTKVDYQKVQLDAEQQTVFLTEPGMKLDLGAIAKGYLTDQVVQTLKAGGVSRGIVDLGGNIYVIGQKDAQSKWQTGIQSPEAKDKILGSLQVADCSVVTSGVYERYLKVNDQTYHHLLDPKTGYPVQNELQSVTIMSDQSIAGDALATAVFVKGKTEGLAFLKAYYPDAGALLVTKQNKILVTQNIQKNFKIAD